MSTPDSSTSARRDGSARDAVESAAHNITDAIEALRITAAFDAHDDTIVDSDGDTPLTFGQARAILAALSAPYVPGCVEVERDAFWKHNNRSAMLTIWPGDIIAGGSTHHYFAAVTE